MKELLNDITGVLIFAIAGVGIHLALKGFGPIFHAFELVMDLPDEPSAKFILGLLLIPVMFFLAAAVVGLVGGFLLRKLST